MTWWMLQGVVVALCLVSEWAVRRGGPRSNRAMRGLFGVALLVWGFPRPVAEVSRLVPLQAPASLDTVRQGVDLALSTTAPVRESLAWLPWALGLGVLALLLAQVAFRVRGLRRARVLHRRGSVTLAVSPDLRSPCTVWLGRTWILLDPTTAADPHRRDLAVRHEARHVRHGDALFAWLTALLVAVCAPNPFAWRLSRNLAQLDEHAVDHVLVHERGVSPRQYGRLLVETATGAPFLQTAPGLAPTSPLHRRLTMIANAPSPRRLPWLLAAVLVGAAAFAAPSASTVDVTEVQRTTSTVLDQPDHAVVDAAIQRLVGNEKGASFVERALERRPKHRASIVAALEEAGLPTELEAVVFIESGYDDQLTTGDLDSAAPAGGPIGAGLWMFIPSTARTYGLQVDKELDERLDPALETQAAIALLSDLHAEFGDWGLALAGYNQGAAHVRRAIDEHGTRDVPTLVEKGGLNRYVPMVWAATRVLESR